MCECKNLRVIENGYLKQCQECGKIKDMFTQEQEQQLSQQLEVEFEALTDDYFDDMYNKSMKRYID